MSDVAAYTLMMDWFQSETCSQAYERWYKFVATDYIFFYSFTCFFY